VSDFSRSARVLLFLLVVALVARLGSLFVFHADLDADPDTYVALAEMVADGQGLTGPYTGRPTAFRPPLLPLVLGSMLWLGLTPATGICVLQLTCGVLTTLVTWQIARRLQLAGIWRVLATLCMALDPLLLRYTALPMTEVPAACLLTAALYCWSVAFSPAHWADTSRTDSVSRFPSVLAGILLGLLALTRPVGLLIVCFLTAAELLRAWPRRRLLLQAVVPAIAAMVVTAPWLVRNALQFNAFVPATTHGGYTLALGNNAAYYADVIRGGQSFWSGTGLSEWQQSMNELAAAEGIPAENEPAMDAWMYQQAIQSMTEQPVLFLRSCLHRQHRFWAVRAVHSVPPSVQQPDAAKTAAERTITSRLLGVASALTSVWYSVIWTGAAIALVTYRRPGWGTELRCVWLVILPFVMVHSLYWTDTRMRSPVMPLLCVASILGWQATGRWWGRRSREESASRDRSVSDQSSQLGHSGNGSG
jgi:4-amino-4-deoxy-L-arabinose transferase-like glycosyltransferase